MSWHPAPEPRCDDAPDGGAVELVVRARRRDIGGFAVRRSLPSAQRRLVGPWIFLDHMGPTQLAPGEGLDVPPHPHIHLATVTYLFEGELLHRDSLGSEQRIRPGAVNWMHAGRGIVHSERSPQELRAEGPRLHGLQLWVALPREHEDSDPTFEHFAAGELPSREGGGVQLRVLAGEAFGLRSPAAGRSPLAFVEARLAAAAALEIPGSHPERCAYVVAGGLRCGGEEYGEGDLLVFAPGAEPRLEATGEGARLALLSGEPLDGPRKISWNFVSSDPAAIERAREDWREGRFPPVPGDDAPGVPLPG